VSSRAEISGNFTAHFTNIFTSSNPPIEAEMLDLFSPIIYEEENVILSSIPTEEEVLEALASLGSTKATGLDGFTALFYKKYWKIVKNDVLQCIWNFFNNNFPLRDQNHSFIDLVPKLSGFHMLFTNSDLLAFATLFIRLSQRFWPTD
jgi:hypothetical protein